MGEANRRITTVSLDLDGTLWDFEKMMRASLAATLVELAKVRDGADRLTVAEMIEIRDFVASNWKEPVQDLDRIRLLAFEETVRRTGPEDRDLAARLNGLYVKHRAENIELFDDVLPALTTLKDSGFSLGVLSNGNTLPERAGIDHLFDFILFAQEVGAEKPDPAIFGAALKASRCRREEFVHVGDSLADDVGGARVAGVMSVWLNRQGRPRVEGIEPDAEIRTLIELQELLAP
ncbi:MAG: HAD family hydrolase [Planctomycetota bacterium]|jgi:putative hydrolase of the HAD superfamily